jgi:hypothetical protein
MLFPCAIAPAYAQVEIVTTLTRSLLDIPAFNAVYPVVIFQTILFTENNLRMLV